MYPITDFHSHILPKADHGSDCIDTSAEQLRLISDCGCSRVVATPHFYPNRDSVTGFLERRSHCASALSTLLSDSTPTVFLGAEVLVCEGLEEIDGLIKLCIYGTNTILLEMPMTSWSRRLIDTVNSINSSGLNVVLAHIDRYPVQDIDILLSSGIKAQLNAGCLCKLFGSKIQLKRVSEGNVVAIGSDLHGCKKDGCADFKHACKKLGIHLEGVMESTNRLLDGAVSLTR